MDRAEPWTRRRRSHGKGDSDSMRRGPAPARKACGGSECRPVAGTAAGSPPPPPRRGSGRDPGPQVVARAAAACSRVSEQTGRAAAPLPALCPLSWLAADLGDDRLCGEKPAVCAGISRASQGSIHTSAVILHPAKTNTPRLLLSPSGTLDHKLRQAQSHQDHKLRQAQSHRLPAARRRLRVHPVDPVAPAEPRAPVEQLRGWRTSCRACPAPA